MLFLGICNAVKQRNMRGNSRVNGVTLGPGALVTALQRERPLSSEDPSSLGQIRYPRSSSRATCQPHLAVVQHEQGLDKVVVRQIRHLGGQSIAQQVLRHGCHPG